MLCVAKLLCGYVGCYETEGLKILQYLAKLNASEIVDGFGNGFSCVLCDTYLQEEPEKAIMKPTEPIDLMLGFSTHEGGGYVFEIVNGISISGKEQAGEVTNEIVLKRFFRGKPGAARVEAEVKKLYLSKCVSNDDLIKELVQMYGDLVFVAPTVDLANKWSCKLMCWCSYTMFDCLTSASIIVLDRSKIILLFVRIFVAWKRLIIG